ncbi:MAG: ribonuclease T2 [Alphaproteobacteria bacterium]|nr:ribonuclease T2 [Alphaproteobacteria bacterium]
MPGSHLARHLRRLAVPSAAAIAVLAALLILPALARDNRPGQFDYFVLSLSWSPTFCAGPDGDRDPSQCAPGRRFAFVVHGLWPQNRDGTWPEFCASRETWVPQKVIEGMMRIMPSKRLIIHQWRKHGSCSGLTIENYFLATRLLFGKLKIPARYLSPQATIQTTPEQLVLDFVKTNRDLTAGMISVQCGNARDTARLSELRICIDRRGDFGQCGAGAQRQCRAQTLVMPPVR